MKPYLVDVPVRVNIWIRPECQRRQFEVIKQARPSIMFLQSDGGRNEKEWEAIYKNRAIFDNEIDWKCTVYKLYEDHNNGLYTMGRKVSDLIWSTVDRCIFLEDDYVPSVCFFQYCAELLEKYKDDLRIESICGMNHLGVCENVTADYFFSRQGSIWGTATWKNRVQARDIQLNYGKDAYVMSLLKQRTRHNPTFWKRIVGYLKDDHYEGHVPGAEFFREFAMYGYNQLQIIPKYNMINNIGFGNDSTHMEELKNMPKSLRGIFNMKTYEITFPLKHADYVIPDVEYEKKRNKIITYNPSPWLKICRVSESVYCKFINGDRTYLFRRILKMIRGDKCIEK